METTDLFTSKLKKIAQRIEGTSALVKALLALTAVVIAGTGAVLLAVYQFPAKPELIPAPVQHTTDQRAQPVPPVMSVREEPEVPSPVLNVAGSWRDDSGNAISIGQTGSSIQFSMGGNSGIGIPVEMTGQGVLNQKSVHIDLEGRVLGQSTGTDKLPIDITFVNEREATISMAGFSGTIYRY